VGGGAKGDDGPPPPLAAQASVRGALLLLLALLLDGVASNAQEQLFSQFAVPKSEIPCFAMGVAAALSVAWGLAAGDLRAGVADGLRDERVAATLAGFTLASYLCNAALLNLIALVGAVPTAFVSAICRAIMIAVSFAVFPKPLARQQLLGMACVFAGVGLSAVGGGAKGDDGPPPPLAAQATTTPIADAEVYQGEEAAAGEVGEREGEGFSPAAVPLEQGDGSASPAPGVRRRHGATPLERLRVPLRSRAVSDSDGFGAGGGNASSGDLAAAPPPAPPASSPLGASTPREASASQPSQSTSPSQQHRDGGSVSGSGGGVRVLLTAVAADLSGAVLGLHRPPDPHMEALSPLRRSASFALAGTPRPGSLPSSPRPASPRPAAAYS
jgi:hypothetical protein